MANNIETESNKMSDVNGISEDLKKFSIEDLNNQHRKERKELKAKIQALKKNAPKKKRKEVLEEIALLEKELEERHKTELENIETEATDINDPPSNGATSVNKIEESDTSQRISKAQKRRDKKEREAREREEAFELARKNIETEETPCSKEVLKIAKWLSAENLALHYVESDGNCLYNAVRHQLEYHNLPTYNVADLRLKTAQYLREHKETLGAFIVNPDTGKILDDDEYETYCDNIEKTAAWGGQVELKALATILKTPIQVLQGEGVPILLGAEFEGPKLTIIYHRHLFQMGEHFNSTKSVDPKEEQDEENATANDHEVSD